MSRLKRQHRYCTGAHPVCMQASLPRVDVNGNYSPHVPQGVEDEKRTCEEGGCLIISSILLYKTRIRVPSLLSQPSLEMVWAPPPLACCKGTRGDSKNRYWPLSTTNPLE